MAPEALPAGYRRWVTNASRVAAPCLPVNLAAYRTGQFSTETAKEVRIAALRFSTTRLMGVLRQIFKWKQPPTPQNASILNSYISAAEGGDFGPPFAPCASVHPWMDSCSWTAVDRWQAVFRWMFPVYAALHVIPPILLRRKVFFKESVNSPFS